jgi:hypothetical protein
MTLSGAKHNDCEKVIKYGLRKGTIKPGTQLILVPDAEFTFTYLVIDLCEYDHNHNNIFPNK